MDESLNCCKKTDEKEARMKTTTKYIKVASHEAIKGKVKKVLLLYSGGLDTSVMLTWIADTYKADVVTLTIDLGQQSDDLVAIQKKALKLTQTLGGKTGNDVPCEKFGFILFEGRDAVYAKAERMVKNVGLATG